MTACGACGGGPDGFIRRPERADNHAWWCPTINDEYRHAICVVPSDNPAAARHARTARAMRAIALHEHGHSVAAIAAWANLDPSTVYRYLKRPDSRAG